MAVDDNGNPYSIGKRTTGASPADIKAKLADLDRENVPSVQAVKIELELAAEEEAKLEKERKGRGEATAAAAPAPDWNEAQHSNDRPRIFYVDPQTNAPPNGKPPPPRGLNDYASNTRESLRNNNRTLTKPPTWKQAERLNTSTTCKGATKHNALLKQQAEELAQEIPAPTDQARGLRRRANLESLQRRAARHLKGHPPRQATIQKGRI